MHESDRRLKTEDAAREFGRETNRREKAAFELAWAKTGRVRQRVDTHTTTRPLDQTRRGMHQRVCAAARGEVPPQLRLDQRDAAGRRRRLCYTARESAGASAPHCVERNGPVGNLIGRKAEYRSDPTDPKPNAQQVHRPDQRNSKRPGHGTDEHRLSTRQVKQHIQARIGEYAVGGRKVV
jgi:hypothetical protein